MTDITAFMGGGSVARECPIITCEGWKDRLAAKAFALERGVLDATAHGADYVQVREGSKVITAKKLVS